MDLLHIYGQAYEHGDAFLVGNTGALKLLRDAIDQALATGQGQTPDTGDCLFAADGEGYTVRVVRNDAEWDDPTWQDSSCQYAHHCNNLGSISPYDLLAPGPQGQDAPRGEG